jgi:hypothetical protein
MATQSNKTSILIINEPLRFRNETAEWYMSPTVIAGAGAGVTALVVATVYWALTPTAAMAYTAVPAAELLL